MESFGEATILLPLLNDIVCELLTELGHADCVLLGPAMFHASRHLAAQVCAQSAHQKARNIFGWFLGFSRFYQKG